MARVLVVDDYEPIRRLQRSALEHAGFEVCEAPGGKAAIAVAKEHRPAVIVMDLRMPEMDGFAVCRALKSDLRTAAIPIVAISAHTGDYVSDLRANDCPFAHFIAKPFDPRVLVNIVRGLMGGATPEA